MSKVIIICSQERRSKWSQENCIATRILNNYKAFNHREYFLEDCSHNADIIKEEECSTLFIFKDDSSIRIHK